ncbi:MAG: 4Fe-4S dicluster domain-containing protein [Micromonosporaceae bacterium]|nr:4Fe-4S dicluster domain-containing protein [Micromonosporaceae bacterium]
MSVLLRSLGPLVERLRADGYRVMGPTVRDGAIVLAELDSADELPYGWETTTGPGRYRLHRRDDRAAFAHAAGPTSWRSFLHPAKRPLWTADRDLAVTEPQPQPQPRYAFLGVRACDLHAIAVTDRVLGKVDGEYARRRAALFIVAVACTEPGATCFCASAGQGPGLDGAGCDLAMTELADGASVRYVVEVRSAAGGAVLSAIPTEAADAWEVNSAREAVKLAAGRMGRSLPEVDLRELLAGALDHPRWDEVADRCLACANCTMACPTCFCTTVVDSTDLTGDHAERWLRWDSCFDLDYSYLHGGPVRVSTRSRYRQWLTHKLGTWHDQFRESGCVGCGRCITWCPVGIDITEEVAALAAGTQVEG